MRVNTIEFLVIEVRLYRDASSTPAAVLPRGARGSKRFTGWFACEACDWQQATRMFWLAAHDKTTRDRCPRCGQLIAFRQTRPQYLANIGREE